MTQHQSPTPPSLEHLEARIGMAMYKVNEALVKTEGHAEAAALIADGARDHLQALRGIIDDAIAAAGEGRD